MFMVICATIFRSYRHLKIVANHLAEKVQFYPFFKVCVVATVDAACVPTKYP